MKRALTVAMLPLMVSAVVVLPAPPASADLGIRICRARTPSITVGSRIDVTGSSWCLGSGSARITTECQLQHLQGLGTRLRWVTVPPQPPRVRSWVWQHACKVTAPREPGRWRGRVRVVATGPNVVKRQGWNQSSAITVR